MELPISEKKFLAFKKAKANARRVRRRSQRQSWIRYVSSLTSSTSSKQLWKKVKAANGIYREFSFPILQTSNSVFSSPEEIANILEFEGALLSSSWREAIVIPILKPGKVATDPLSYRPIALTSCFSVRYFNVRIGHSSSHKFIQDQGVPQGSVLSVTLFNIHMSNILHQLPPSVRGMLYVDDLQVSCQGSDMRLIERQLQTTVNRLVQWCDQNGHTISPSKSSCVHFCRKRNLHPDPSIHIGHIQIPVVSAVRFLGVIFDCKLTFLPHVLYLRKRCERSLNILKVLSNTLWGADRVSLLRVYHALILSRLDYGCAVYGSARASVLRRLDTIHHSALVPSELRLLPACMWYATNHL
ncbi:putative RNA-directed DNA polymerase from transposon X-element [Trichonephila clavipes]|nr:putative RNA-directed DNA polymerase from transposon X-element [Trichonephila clavipes]